MVLKCWRDAAPDRLAITPTSTSATGRGSAPLPDITEFARIASGRGSGHRAGAGSPDAADGRHPDHSHRAGAVTTPALSWACMRAGERVSVAPTGWAPTAVGYQRLRSSGRHRRRQLCAGSHFVDMPPNPEAMVGWVSDILSGTNERVADIRGRCSSRWTTPRGNLHRGRP